MEIGKFRYACKYPNCKNKYYSPIIDKTFKNKHFFMFPKDKKLLNIWKNVCKIGLNVNCTHFYVCEDHFQDEDFKNETRTRLNYKVVPKHLVQGDQVNEQINPVFPTEINFASFSACNNTPTEQSPSSSDNHNAEQSDVRTIIELTDHTYVKSIDMPIMNNCANFDFLLEERGILSSVGMNKIDLTPRKLKMYKLYGILTYKLTKLRNLLAKERNQVKVLARLHEEGKFQFIDERFNSITKEFLDLQLQNLNNKPSAKRWTTENKIFALSLYKRSPRLYKHLLTFFELPAPKTLKRLLANIPFDTGINENLLGDLQSEVEKLDPLDKYCVLLFDQMSLCNGFHYEPHEQLICGFEDLGELCRSSEPANHALVFMARGVRKTWKQVVAYYFTAATISAMNLKQLIISIIDRLQKIGFEVVATVCDQGPTNQAALNELCSNNTVKPCPYYFVVNNKNICTIYDVPHLLKDTRNALLRCAIQYDENKFAKFEYIESAYTLDKQKRAFSQLPKLNLFHFNFNDAYLKMKVKVAAAQLSHSVAASIETWVTSGHLPPEAIFTAEFADNIDMLFDSLNGFGFQSSKQFRRALSPDSPHLELWSALLPQLTQWKLIELKSANDVTSQYDFVRGWQVTVRSIIHIWHKLHQDGFRFLSLRSFNQDPLENLFCMIRQHAKYNTNPTCHQFVAALKTCIINHLSNNSKNSGNCEADNCSPLSSLTHLLNNCDIPRESDLNSEEFHLEGKTIHNHICNVEDNQATAYVAGYILKKIKIGDCDSCKRTFLSNDVTNKHYYASNEIISLTDEIHTRLYSFLDKNGHLKQLENKFKEFHKEMFDSFNNFCNEHDHLLHFIDNCIRLVIYMYVKEKKQANTVTIGHENEMKKFKAM